MARGLDRHLDVVLAGEREDPRDVVGRGDLGDALGEIKGRLRLTEASVARRVLAAGASPEAGYGLICYLTPPSGGLVIELVSTDLKPVISEWLTADA